MRVVVADTDTINTRLIECILTEAGHTVTVALSAAEAFRCLSVDASDALILDTDLPDLSGFDLCKELRSHGYTGPIMLVSHDHSIHQRIRALQLGADDYLVKPYDPRELLVRIETISRRSRQFSAYSSDAVLRIKQVELSFQELVYRVDGQEPVPLTPTEARLLAYLMRHAEVTVSREMLIEHVWGQYLDGVGNRLDAYISRLRRKIERDPEHPEFLRTVRGIGYVFRTGTHSSNSEKPDSL